jgi:hypothetical protein
LRNTAEVALGWGGNVDLIAHSPRRIWRRSCSSVT